MGRQLSERDLNELRTRKLIKENETAFKEGTSIIAENLLTKQRRVVDTTGLVLEADRIILHD